MADESYTGTDNLEVMSEAVNYNRFLVDLVTRHAQGAEAILDFGAGIGTFAAELKGRGLDVVCLEPDPRQQAMLREQGLRAIRDLGELQDGSLDYVYSLNVLEHIDDDVGVLEAIRSKLRPGGRLLIYVPAFDLLYSSMDRKVGHVRRYRRSELSSKAKRAGFRVDDARYVDSLGFFAALLFRAIGNESGDINRTPLIVYDRLLFPLSRVADLALHPILGKNLLLRATRT